MRRVTLELGGKAASIVCEDADLDVFAANVNSTSRISGRQAGVLHSCVLAPRLRYSEVVEAVSGVDLRTDGVECSSRSGSGLCRCGPDFGRPRGSWRWAAAVASGRMVRRADSHSAHGQFECIGTGRGFGRVVVVIPNAGEAKAVDLGSLFGGFKSSGIGQEFGPEGLASFVEYQSIYVSADQLAGRRAKKERADSEDACGGAVGSGRAMVGGGDRARRPPKR